MSRNTQRKSLRDLKERLRELRQRMQGADTTHNSGDWHNHETAVNEAQDILNAAVQLRDSGDPEAYALWRDAAAHFHQTLAAHHPLGEEMIQHLREGDPDAVENALQFLEADPWYFRSGYIKEDVIRFLKRQDLSGSDAERVRQIVLQKVDAPRAGREWPHYARLARRVDSPTFRAALAERASHLTPAGDRARYILAVMDGQDPRNIRKLGRYLSTSSG